jgi:hypothetical protein
MHRFVSSTAGKTKPHRAPLGVEVHAVPMGGLRDNEGVQCCHSFLLGALEPALVTNLALDEVELAI